MLNLELSYADYSLLIQCLLTRIDFIKALIRSVADSDPNLYAFYSDALNAIHTFYTNVRNI
jgi:hypothetical protein